MNQSKCSNLWSFLGHWWSGGVFTWVDFLVSFSEINHHNKSWSIHFYPSFKKLRISLTFAIFCTLFLMNSITGSLSVKAGMGNQGTACGEWCEREKSGWECRESRWECGESGWLEMGVEMLGIPWFPVFPPWFPEFPSWFPVFPPWFPAFAHWSSAFLSFPSFRSPIPHSAFYR